MKTWKMVPLFALAGALFLQAQPAHAHGTSPCRDDVKRLCGQDQYSRTGIAACLEQHTSELSPDCQKRYAQIKAHIEAFKQACDADTQKLCPTADRGMKTVRCLHDHEKDLSQACKDKVAEVRKNHRAKRQHEGGAPAKSTQP